MEFHNKSSIRTAKSAGASTEPWFTPVRRGNESEIQFFHLIADTLRGSQLANKSINDTGTFLLYSLMRRAL
mgnify:CR=1 FL=1